MRNLFFYAVILSALCTAQSSLAAGCLLTGDTQSENIDTGDILVQRDVPVGSILYRKVLPASGASLGTCENGSYVKQVQLISTQLISGYTDLYQSGLQGIGIRLQLGMNTLSGSRNESLNGPATLNDDETIIFSLIKTGPVDPGALTYQDLLKISYTGENTGSVTAKQVSLTGGVVSQASCQVTSPAVVVEMGNLEKKNLKGVNSVAATRDFQISMNCNRNTNVNITFSPLSARSANSINLKGVVEGDAFSGAATGVGVQMLFGGAPIEFNTLLPVGTTTSDGIFNIPLQARYYQILDAVTPGLVNAMISFTMTYQ